MIDLSTETPIRLDEAARLVPPSRGATRTHVSTVLRWIMGGVRAPSGERVRLEGLRLGGKWTTTREALQRFAERLTPDLAGERPRVLRPPTTRRCASERAARQLERLGM